MTEKEVERLFAETVPLIKRMANFSVYKTYKISSIYVEEFESVCRLSFVKAIRGFDETQNVDFSTYFVTIARRDIHREAKKILKRKECAYLDNLSGKTTCVEDDVVKSDIELCLEELSESAKSKRVKQGAKALLLQAEGYTLDGISHEMKLKRSVVDKYMSVAKQFIRNNYTLESFKTA